MYWCYIIKRMMVSLLHTSKSQDFLRFEQQLVRYINHQIVSCQLVSAQLPDLLTIQKKAYIKEGCKCCCMNVSSNKQKCFSIYFWDPQECEIIKDGHWLFFITFYDTLLSKYFKLIVNLQKFFNHFLTDKFSDEPLTWTF